MVGSLKKVIATAVFFTLILVQTGNAATSKPTPKPTVSSKSTFKAALKPKKYVPRKAVVRKKIKVTPSPSPKWPPPNYSHSGTIYAKVPTAEELKGAASNSLTLTADLKVCEIHTCGAVFVSSESGCTYWEVDSVVSQSDANDQKIKKPLGALRTLTYGSKPKTIATILLISDEPLNDLVSVGGITAKCWNTTPGGKVPSNTYTPIPKTD
jgi:hypothetical protein